MEITKVEIATRVCCKVDNRRLNSLSLPSSFRVIPRATRIRILQQLILFEQQQVRIGADSSDKSTYVSIRQIQETADKRRKMTNANL
jgi:hypothetical protein